MKETLSQLLRGEIHLHYDRLTFVNNNLTPTRLFNHLLRGVESRLRRSRPWSYPFGLQLEPTVRCQLACPECPRTTNVGGSSEEEMRWDDYVRLMKEIGPHLAVIAFWQWGEPLLHPRIADMVRLANNYGCLSLISTNAQVGADYDVGALFEAGLDMIIISMDGTSQEVYDRFRQDGSVDRVKEFAAKCAEEKRRLGLNAPLINLRTVATVDNEVEIDALRDLARDIGADAYTVKSVSLYYDASPENTALPHDRELRSFQYQGSEEAAIYLAEKNFCRKAWYWPCLRHDGELLVCECDHRRESPLGNIFQEGSFRRVWRSSQAAELRRNFGTDGRIGVEFCERCRYKRDDAIRRLERFETDRPG
ncbi:MAG: hypothetical protein C0616_14055 [Desulfuromonas sp.]|nr:MAG: hypothetical protein C0616_14055 [Desulfuromonas sp.]